MCHQARKDTSRRNSGSKAVGAFVAKRRTGRADQLKLLRQTDASFSRTPLCPLGVKPDIRVSFPRGDFAEFRAPPGTVTASIRPRTVNDDTRNGRRGVGSASRNKENETIDGEGKGREEGPSER